MDLDWNTDKIKRYINKIEFFLRKLKGKVKKLNSLSDYTGYDRKEIIPKEKELFLSAIKTKHIKDSEESYGIKFFAQYEKECIISYTSDTVYFEELARFFAEQDILVFNVSDIYI